MCVHKHIHTKNKKCWDVSIHYKIEIKNWGIENYKFNIHLSVLGDQTKEKASTKFYNLCSIIKRTIY